jgi:hypothetical protein
MVTDEMQDVRVHVTRPIERGSIVVLEGNLIDNDAAIMHQLKRAAGHDRFVLIVSEEGTVGVEVHSPATLRELLSEMAKEAIDEALKKKPKEAKDRRTTS